MAEPVHLLAYVGARLTMCGRRSNTVPTLWLFWLPMHQLGHARAGRPLVVCEDCQAEA
jgi:hypothetical protein